MENLSTDNLMRLQVEQLEKEKRELNEKMRIVAKRLDHVERAYRKEERPLLAKDYEIQQANDRAAHEAAQKARIETARLTHQQDLETKKRLLRILDDYKAYREVIISKRGEEFTKRQQLAQKKIDEEKAKRRAAVLKQREEERLHREEEERRRREIEEEERRLEEGKSFAQAYHKVCSHDRTCPERLAEEERRRAEEEAAREAEEAKKREEAEKAAALRQQREAERAKAAEQARLQAQREEEALERQRQRAAEREREKLAARAPPARTTPPAAAAAATTTTTTTSDTGVWRRSTPAARTTWIHR